MICSGGANKIAFGLSIMCVCSLLWQALCFSSTFQLADENQDGLLNREEFAAFLHPEEFPRMRVVVVEETMEDMDKNQDGFVTVDEYISTQTNIWGRIM